MRSALTVKRRQSVASANKVTRVFRPRAFWIETYTAYKRSDLSLTKFSESKGLPYSTALKWLKRLEHEGKQSTGCFVRVEVDEEPMIPDGERPVEQESCNSTNKAPTLPIETSPDLKLTLNSGLVLSIPKHFDALTLRQIVQALEPC